MYEGARMPDAHYRSKTLATWVAVFGGTLGLHRMYLHGLRDLWAWLHAIPTALGLIGVQRLRDLGQDDRLGWALSPLLGLMIAQGMLCAIIYGLTPDERWDARRNPDHPPTRTGWGAVLGVIAALLIGAAALTSSIAYGVQKFFEWDLESQGAARTAAAQADSSTMLSISLATSSQRSVTDSSCS
jgi:hypothetical protein